MDPDALKRRNIRKLDYFKSSQTSSVKVFFVKIPDYHAYN